MQFIGQLIEHKPIVERVRGEKLETSALGLTFRIKPKYVKQGLKLECTASIGSVYWQSFLETPKVSPKEQISIYGNLWGSSDANGKMFSVFFQKYISCIYIFKLLHSYYYSLVLIKSIAILKKKFLRSKKVFKKNSSYFLLK